MSMSVTSLFRAQYSAFILRSVGTFQQLLRVRALDWGIFPRVSQGRGHKIGVLMCRWKTRPGLGLFHLLLDLALAFLLFIALVGL